MTMTHIETIELTSSQTSITFSSIPQDYDDLVLKLSLRSDRSLEVDLIDILLNGSSANFSFVALRTNPNPLSTSGTNNEAGFTSANTSTANTFGSMGIYISNYSAAQNKSISVDAVTEDNSVEAFTDIRAILWSDTSSITSVGFVPVLGTNFLTGSTASLYGVTAGGDGTVTTA